MQLTFLERIKYKVAQSIPVRPSRLNLKRGTLTICFDDFPQSAWTVAGAILEHYEVSATYFACGGLCNNTYRGIKYFSEQNLQDISLSRHEIGCHTFDHVSALKVSLREFGRSIDKNREFFSSRIKNRKIENFAFPYNHVTVASKLLVARLYSSGRGVGATTHNRWFDSTEIAAVNLSLSSAAAPVGHRLHDLPLLIEQADRERKWLVVYTHDVSNAPSEHGCRERDFENLIVRAKQAGLDIKPVREVISR